MLCDLTQSGTHEWGSDSAPATKRKSVRPMSAPHAAGEDQAVKVTINVDCKPAEAREFCGLPDLRPLQAAWLLEIEKRMLAEVERRPAASRGAKLVIWNRSSQHYGRALSRMRQQECGLALCLRNRMAILECAEWPSPAAAAPASATLRRNRRTAVEQRRG